MAAMIPCFQSAFGKLYQADCIEMMQSLNADSVDLAFADPPFNLGKKYSSKIDDSLGSSEYLTWCHRWLDQMIRVVKPGGSLFVWNLPKWT